MAKRAATNKNNNNAPSVLNFRRYNNKRFKGKRCFDFAGYDPVDPDLALNTDGTQHVGRHCLINDQFIGPLSVWLGKPQTNSQVRYIVGGQLVHDEMCWHDMLQYGRCLSTLFITDQGHRRAGGFAFPSPVQYSATDFLAWVTKGDSSYALEAYQHKEVKRLLDADELSYTDNIYDSWCDLCHSAHSRAGMPYEEGDFTHALLAVHNWAGKNTRDTQVTYNEPSQKLC